MTPAPTTTSDEATTLHRSRSAERALTLLDTVITRGSIGLSDAAGQVGIPTSTALRHLRALMLSGYLVRDDLGQYSVGPTFLRLALASFQSGPYARLVAAAQPHLDQLAAATEESVYLAVRDGVNAVYIATVESPRAIRHVGWVGRSVPLDGTAVGDALLAPALPPGRDPSSPSTPGRSSRRHGADRADLRRLRGRRRPLGSRPRRPVWPATASSAPERR